MHQVTYIHAGRIISTQSPNAADMRNLFVMLSRAGCKPRLWDRTTKHPRLIA